MDKDGKSAESSVAYTPNGTPEDKEEDEQIKWCGQASALWNSPLVRSTLTFTKRIQLVRM